MRPLIIFLTIILLSESYVFAQNLNEGLVAHWTFDNDSLNIVMDETENKINGTPYDIDYVEGVKGKAIYFDSDNDGIYFPDSISTPTEVVGNLTMGTISVWFSFQNNGPYILPIIYFGEDSAEEDHNSLIIEIGHADKIENRKLYFTIVNQLFCFDSRENLIPDKWYHFVAVVGSNSNTGYLNGKELTNRKYNLGSNSSYRKFFADVPVKDILTLGYGRYGMCGKFFNYRGKIDDVRIYDRALSANEVESLWNEVNLSTNVNSLQKNGIESLTIFPNPTREFITVQSENLNQVLDIYSITGQKIISFDIRNNKKLSVKDLQKGIYIARTNTGENAKFIIQ